MGRERQTQFDFSTAKVPFALKPPKEKFDLIITLEFLEHVPRGQAAALAAFTAAHADTLVIGAAITGQGGTGHVNEQWVEYWDQLLRSHRFELSDFIRPRILDDGRIES